MCIGLVFAIGVSAPGQQAALPQRQDQHSAQERGNEKQPPDNGKEADEITVTGNRAPVERTTQGTHYDERGNPQGQSGSSLDILRTVPSVAIGADGALTVRGNSDVKVYINGKPSASSDPVSLQAIAGSSVASVDVITNPAAGYDANGSIIINLTLDKGERDGLHSTAIVNGGSRGQANAALDTSFGSKALVASLKLSIADSVPVMRKRASIILFDATGRPTADFETVARYDNDHRQSANLQSSIGYEVDAASDIGIEANYTAARPLDVVREHHVDRTVDMPAILYDRTRGGSYIQKAHDISAHYQRHGTGRQVSLKLEVQDSRRSTDSNRVFVTRFERGDRPPLAERVRNRWSFATRRATLDIAKAVGGGVTISGGGAWRRDESPAFNRRGDSPPVDFDPVQRTGALYLSAKMQSGDWTIDAGGRFEHVALDTLLRSSGIEHRRRYSLFNDTIAIARKLGDDRVMLSASHATQRISANDLNPAITYIDAQNISVGNPDLAPQKVSSFEAEYDHVRGGFNGALTLYYRHVDDTIDELYYFRPDNVVVRTRDNGGPSHSLGATITLSEKLSHRLSFGTTVNVFRSELSVLGLSDRPTG